VARRCFRSCSWSSKRRIRRVHHACARAGLAFRAPSAEMLGRLLRKTLRAFASRPPAPSPLATTKPRPKYKPPWSARRHRSCDSWPGLPWTRNSEPRRSRLRRTRISPPSFAALVRGTGRMVAADWLLAQFDKLEPGTRIATLGQWLGHAPQVAIAKLNRGLHPSSERSASFRPVRKPDAIAFGVAPR